MTALIQLLNQGTGQLGSKWTPVHKVYIGAAKLLSPFQSSENFSQSCMEKFNMKVLLCSFSFSFVLFSPSCKTKIHYGVCKYYVYQTTALQPGLFLLWLGAAYVLQLLSYRATPLSPSAQDILVQQLLWLLFLYSGHGKYSQATPGQLNLCVTSCDKFASMHQFKLCASRSLTVVFFINLVYLQTV